MIKIIFLGMDSIENMISYMSPGRLMIKIWEFSDHFLHSAPDKSFDCPWEKYLNMCIDAARDFRDNENYIYFNTALYYFQFHRKKYQCLMSLKNEDYKEQLIEGILRVKDIYIFFIENDFYSNNHS